jgi:arginine-tRNA-protein transferase
VTPFAHRDQLTSLTPERLDAYWAHGWFRMRQNVFTTHFLEFGGKFHSAIWLRVDLPSWREDRRFAALAKRNRAFTAEIGACDPRSTSLVHEALFQKYRDSLDFDVSPTLQSLLFGRHRSSRFQTHEVNLYDAGVLVAAGIFDLGGDSAGGITTFYNPDYHKYSLGKYLIYLKMEFCRNLGLKWFYPGYFAPGHRRFDYKLEMGTSALQFLELSSGEWRPYTLDLSVPLTEMEVRLAEVAYGLASHGIDAPLYHYRHLDANLHPQLHGLELFDMPVFLSLLPMVITYDPRPGQYQLLVCRSVYHFDESSGEPGIWDSDLLSVQQLLFSTPSAEEILALLRAGLFAQH